MKGGEEPTDARSSTPSRSSAMTQAKPNPEQWAASRSNNSATILRASVFGCLPCNPCVSRRTTPRDELLELICNKLGMGQDNPAFIVSPSMSGSFSIPLLLRKPSLFSGYVPIATGMALTHTAAEFNAVKNVPTLIVYGERDNAGRRASELLASIPGSIVLMISDATHPAYVDNPELFHSHLLEFLGA